MNTSDVSAQKWAEIPDFAIPSKLEVQVILSNRSSVKKVRNELSINDGLKVCYICYKVSGNKRSETPWYYNPIAKLVLRYMISRFFYVIHKPSQRP